MTRLGSVAFLVRDYDEAIAWFKTALSFQVLEDTDLGSGKRWVRVAGRDGGTVLLLARADGPEQSSHVGKAAGGRVAYFLETQDFQQQHRRMIAHGVTFHESPRNEKYGTVAVFEDLYGNRWDLIEPRT